MLASLAPDGVGALLAALGEAGDAGREARIAVAALLPPDDVPPGPPASPRLPAVRGLVEARPAGAWATSPADAPDQQQVVIAVAKEGGRVAPLVALIDHGELGGALKDAFFLPTWRRRACGARSSPRWRRWACRAPRRARRGHRRAACRPGGQRPDRLDAAVAAPPAGRRPARALGAAAPPGRPERRG